MADDVQVVFSAQIGQLIDGVAQVKESILSIAEPAKELVSAFSEVGEAMLAAFAVERVEAFFEKFAELGAATLRNAAMLGVTTEQIGGLEAIARSSGGSIDNLVNTMVRLGHSLENAGAGNERAVAAFRDLGISIKEFQALSPEQKLELLADKFAVLRDGIEKDALATDLLGRSGAMMIPMLNQGAEGIRRFQEIAERAGATMSKETAAGFDATSVALLEMSLSFRGLGMTIASTFKPAFDGIIRIITDVVQGLNASARGSIGFGGALTLLSGAARSVATALSVMVAFLETIWTVGKTVIEALANDFRQLGKIIYSAMTFDLDGIKAAWSDLMAANRKVAVSAAADMTGIVRNMTSELATIWGNGAKVYEEIEQRKKASSTLANKDAVAAAMAAAQEQIKIADMQFQQESERLNSAAKQMQMTETQKTQALLAALDQRYNAELSALAQESEIHGLSKAQYQKILNDQEQLDQKYLQDRQRLIDQAAEREAQTWKAAADQVAGAFNSQLRGLLAGTTSFSQAMKSIAGDMILKLIEDADKWALEWIAQQLRVALFGNALKTTDVTTTAATETAKTTAVTAGVSARAAAESTGATTGLIAQIGNAVAVISADAAKTFAGVFAFLSPEMGPAAAGPATAAAATVEAAAGVAVPGLSVGTDYVLSEGLAYLHSGEQVVPAQTSGPYTGANSGGGGQQVIFSPQLSAFNPSGLQQLLVSIMPQLARELNRYQGLNPSLTGA